MVLVTNLSIKLFLKMDVTRSPPTHTMMESTVLLIFDCIILIILSGCGIGFDQGDTKIKGDNCCQVFVLTRVFTTSSLDRSMNAMS